MEHYSPLPMALLCSLFGGVACAVLVLTFAGGWLLALLAYSFGGAVTLIATAAVLGQVQNRAQTSTARSNAKSPMRGPAFS